MKTYKGLLTEYFKRSKRLEKIAESGFRKRMVTIYPMDLFQKVQDDISSIRDEEAEEFKYLRERHFQKSRIF